METNQGTEMNLQRIYGIVIDEWGDPRVRHYFWVNTPFPVIGAIFCYLYFVRVFGPKFMKTREPYDLKKYIVVYNFIQIIWNSIIFKTGITYIMNTLSIEHWLCIPLFSGNDYIDGMVVNGAYLYFLNKIFDFMDTVFFILRKKFDQVTFLHVYHHISMAFFTWIFAKYSPGGNMCSGAIFNSMIHILMYVYYQMSLLKFGNTDKWKKHMTQFQIVQLIAVGLHNFIILFRNPCKSNIWLNSLLAFQTFYLAQLFIKFYYRAYWKKEKKT